ncbi:hypothetical protein AN958_01764 [Leucoagaricus sp. SymC.cos]|nr:hypothetical protein AN958_01764 [Leucoagaricus sp. SymC.cos]
MASSRPRPRPLQENHVFTASGSSLIDAQADRVWPAVIDFQSYKMWNPLVRNQVVTDSRKNPLPDQTPRVGSHLYMYPVHLPPTMDDASIGVFSRGSAFCILTALDHEDFKIAWRLSGLPTWILWSERWQWLTETEADLDDGKGKRWVTKYESVEVFGGLAAYFVKWFVGSKLNQASEGTAACQSSDVFFNSILGLTNALVFEYSSSPHDHIRA